MKYDVIIVEFTKLKGIFPQKTAIVAFITIYISNEVKGGAF